MKKINLVNGIVDNVETNSQLPASNVEPFVVADTIEVFGGYTSNGDGTFTAPVPPAPSENELQEYAANKRWEVETGGTLFNGLNIPTDDRAKTLIEGAADDLADAETTSFKVNGAWMTLDGVTMRLVRTALRTHVKNCFAKEAEISGLIDNDTITTYAQIDAQNWPS